MFAPTHMAVGALVDSRIKSRATVVPIAILSHAALDITVFWHAPYKWPDDAPAIAKVIPYPHDWTSALVVAALVIATLLVGFLLRRYWWGMLWGASPDILDWVLLRPITGHSSIHNFFHRVSTPWGFGVEMLLAAAVVLLVLRVFESRRGQRQPYRK